MKSRSPHYVDYGLNSPPPAVRRRGRSFLCKIILVQRRFCNPPERDALSAARKIFSEPLDKFLVFEYTNFCLFDLAILWRRSSVG